MKVDVYRNLHKPGFFSIKSREKADRGLKVGEGTYVVIHNVKFAVQHGGRERCIRQSQRNVHAFVRGDWNAMAHFGGTDATELEAAFTRCRLYHENFSLEEVTYNPYKYNSFVLKDTGKAIHSAPWCVCTGTGVWILRGQDRSSS